MFDTSGGNIIALNYFPTFHPPLSGGEQRAFYVLDALSKYYNVISFVPTYPSTRDEVFRFSDSFEERRFSKTNIYCKWDAEIKKAKSKFNSSSLSCALAIRYHKKLRDAVKEEWDNCNIVLLQHPCVLPLIDGFDLTNKRIVYLSYNCEMELIAQHMPEEAWPTYLSLISQLEFRLCALSQHVVVVSHEDKQKMAALYSVPESKFILIPNGSISRFGTSELLLEKEPTHVNAIFIGSNWAPNVEAANYINDKIAPFVQDVQFNFVGDVCKSVNGEISKNVVLHDKLCDNDLSKLLLSTSIGLNPMASGGGSNVKISDYLAHGLQIITTKIGARGFPTTLSNIHIVDLPQFISEIKKISASPPDGTARENLRTSTKQIWDWRELVSPLVEAINAPVPPRDSLRRVIVLNEFPIQGSDSGGQARVVGLYKAAKQDELYIAISFGRSSFRINLLSDRFVCIEIPATSRQKNEVRSFNRLAYNGTDDIVYPLYIDDNIFWLQLARLIMAESDCIIFSHPYMVPVYERLVTSRPFIYDSHNVETLLKRDAHECNPNCDELLNHVEKSENFLIANAELIAACSNSDAEYFRIRRSKQTIVVENGIDAPLQHGLHDSIEDALKDESHFGEPNFFNRRIFLIEEFDNLEVDVFIDTVYRCLCSRYPTSVEVENGLNCIESDLDRAKFIVSLMEGAQNTQKVFVINAKKRIAKPESFAVFIGSGHRPNLVAAEFIVNILAHEVVDVDFVIVGSVGNSINITNCPRNVYIAKFVSNNLKSYIFSKATVGLNPIVSGGGSNLKIPDYISHDLPVVTTAFGERGFLLDEKDGFFISSLANFHLAVDKIINTFSKTKPVITPKIDAFYEQYSWGSLSEKFLAHVREEIDKKSIGDILVVCESVFVFGQTSFSSAAKLVEFLSCKNLIPEILAEAQGVDPEMAMHVKSCIPSGIKNVTITAQNQECLLHASALTTYDNILLNKVNIVCMQSNKQALNAAIDRFDVLAPILLSGASNPLLSNEHWRFFSDEVLIAVPFGSRAIIIHGVAFQKTKIELFSSPGNDFNFSKVVDGRFCLRVDFSGPTKFVTIRTAFLDKNCCESLHMQCNRIAVDLGAVEVESDLWITSDSILRTLGLGYECRQFINGRFCQDISQELLLIAKNKAAKYNNLLAVGSTKFITSIKKELKHCNGNFVGYNGTDFISGDDLTERESLILPVDDAEIGYSQNASEQNYLSRKFSKPFPVLFLLDTLDATTIQFVNRTAHLLKQFDGTDIIAIVARFTCTSLSHKKKILESVKFKIIQPAMLKTTLAVLASARLIVFNDSPLFLGRVPTLLNVLRSNGVIWCNGQSDSHDLFQSFPIVSSPHEILNIIVNDSKIDTPKLSSQCLKDEHILSFFSGALN